uniref:DUF834 domain-containing protein n=1 Tax=Oryza meridionalis TaxID=40149 RepID=A0A0E0DAH1_9ORYZ
MRAAPFPRRTCTPPPSVRTCTPPCSTPPSSLRTCMRMRSAQREGGCDESSSADGSASAAITSSNRIRSPHWACGGWGATCPPLDRLVDGHRRGFPEADVGVVAPKLELHGVVDGGHEASDDVVGAAGAADNGDLLVAEGGVRGFGSRRSEEAPAV